MTLAARVAQCALDKENWKYTDLRKLLPIKNPARSEIKNPDAPTAPRFVFKNGAWQKDMSHFFDLPSATIRQDAQGIVHFNFAEHTCLVTTPIEFLFLNDGDAPTDITSAITINLGANTRLTLVENHIGDGLATHIMNLDINLGAQAKLAHYKTTHNGGAHLAMRHVTLGAGAYYKSFSLLKNHALIRDEAVIDLMEPLAQVEMLGLLLARGGEHIDATTKTTHHTCDGTSRQFYKSILDDKARGVFQGKICVEPKAQHTLAGQLSRALLLSPLTEMNVKPELKILADDVQCNHGSSMGDLDKDAMFYLQSRGLSVAQARAMLLHAFCHEVVEAIESEDMRGTFSDLINRWLDGK